MGKGIRQNRFVTLGKELALKDGYVGVLFDLNACTLDLGRCKNFSGFVEYVSLTT